MSTKDTLISLPREKRVRIDIEIQKIDRKKFIARNPSGEEPLIIPRKATAPAFRTASWQRYIEIEQPRDFVVLERFKGDDVFWTKKDVDRMLVRRRKHIDSRKTHLVMAGYGNIDLSSPGTFFIAFCSKVEIAPTWSLWSLQCRKYDHALVLALWLNSTFALIDLIKGRTEVRGTNIKWRKMQVQQLGVPNVHSMSTSEIRRAGSLLHSLGKMSWPCLIRQLETAYEGRVMLDKHFADLLQMNITVEGILDMQRDVGSWLKKMQKMMMRD